MDSTDRDDGQISDDGTRAWLQPISLRKDAEIGNGDCISFANIAKISTQIIHSFQDPVIPVMWSSE
jgi:hypothetical protein